MDISGITSTIDLMPDPLIILETERLLIRQFTKDDALFILRLVNEPSWIEFIGDRNVHTLNDAELYILNGPVRSYTEHGFCFGLVSLKENGTPIGMCGLAKRPVLDHPDIGFAFLPEYTGMGYALEAARATMKHAFDTLGLTIIQAFTTKHNARSIQFLRKVGFHFEKIWVLEGEELFLFSTDAFQKDREVTQQ